MRKISSIIISIMSFLHPLNIDEVCITFVQSLNTKTTILPIDREGAISNFTQLPMCEKGKLINLENYFYQKDICNHDSSCSSEPKQLTLEAKVSVYSSCSLRERCRNISFPVTDIHKDGYNSVHISYQCLPESDFFNICSNATITNNKTLHLVYSYNATAFKKCDCDIDGLFTLTSNDIRLKDAADTSCSKWTVQVDFRTYTCNSTSGDYGAVFQQTLYESEKFTYITLNANSETITPEMVWFVMQPEQSTLSTVSCHNVPREQQMTTPPYSSESTGKWNSKIIESTLSTVSCQNVPREQKMTTPPYSSESTGKWNSKIIGGNETFHNISNDRQVLVLSLAVAGFAVVTLVTMALLCKACHIEPSSKVRTLRTRKEKRTETEIRESLADGTRPDEENTYNVVVFQVKRNAPDPTYDHLKYKNP